MAATAALTTSMHFLRQKDLYLEQKPYTIRYEPDENSFAKSNVDLQKYDDVQVEDIRSREADFSIERNGFAVMPLITSMNYQDFDSDELIVNKFLKEVANTVQRYMGADEVQVFEHTIRKQHEEFPIATGGTYRYNQPTCTAHIDSTSAWVEELIAKMNEDDKSSRHANCRWQCLNIWAPLRGPVREWPLSLCDASTVHSEDIEPADLVFAKYCIEICQVYRNPLHKWYYLSDQQPSEAWIFRQSSSKALGTLKGEFLRPETEPLQSSFVPGVPHSAFPNPHATPNDTKRESIEVRVICFYKD